VQECELVAAAYPGGKATSDDGIGRIRLCSNIGLRRHHNLDRIGFDNFKL
jgi:hypothetical protein